VFRFIGQPLTDAGWAEMELWREANKREARPSHDYSLATFGLTREQIERQFEDYRAHFITSAGAA
jgi:hypothetical protein